MEGQKGLKGGKTDAWVLIWFMVMSRIVPTDFGEGLLQTLHNSQPAITKLVTEWPIEKKSEISINIADAARRTKDGVVEWEV